MNLDLRTIPAIYINLKKDIKKDFEMKRLMVDFGFKNVIRVEGNLTPDRPLAGCSLSHYNALREVDPPFIIFEDDCLIKNNTPEISIPDDADALYLGISSWGRMNSHSGPCVQYEYYFKEVDINLLRVYNMLGAHSILYLNDEYVSLCKKIAKNAYEIADHQDIGFAEIQRYYNVYAFNDPLFYQTSSNGTDQPLTTYPTAEVFQPNRNFWKPTQLYDF